MNQKFSIQINEDDIQETIRFIRENASISADLLYTSWGTAGISSISIPYVKGELEPKDLRVIGELFSRFNHIVSKPPKP